MPPLKIIIMGVCGCGKSTVGKLLAQELSGHFIDGDDLHPAANIEKMKAGQPLTDQDRSPWLDHIGEHLSTAQETTVIACSALRRAYRDRIRAAAPDTTFIHLHGTKELLANRLTARPGHFMPASLLDSQLATLEPLQAEETGKQFDIAQDPAAIAADTAAWLHALAEGPHNPQGARSC
ncbi:gluconokinase [Arthrobacter sp. MAHUQ-56]